MDAQQHDSGGEHAFQHKTDQHSECNTPTIVVNNRKVFLHAGRYEVATLKKLAGVALADDLDELVNSTLVPVRDDATLTLKGCEIFVSHIKDGGSS